MVLMEVMIILMQAILLVWILSKKELLLHGFILINLQMQE